MARIASCAVSIESLTGIMTCRLLFIGSVRFFLEFEVATEVVLADDGVSSQFFRCSVEEDFSLKEEVSSVGNHECLVHVMVGDEDADVLGLESPNDVLNLLHSDGVYTGERLVEHDEFRLYGQAACYFRTASFTTRETVTEVLAHMVEVELLDELLDFLLLVLFGELGHFQHGANIILDGQFAEDAGLLRQVTDTQLRTFVHRQTGDILVVEEDTSAIGRNKADSHVESGCLAGTIRTEQADYLALLEVDTHIVHDSSLAVFLEEVFGS